MRDITVADVPLLIESLYDLHSESPRYGLVDPDEDYVSERLSQMIQQPTFIGVMDEQMRGYMFGAATQTWFDPTLDAYEHLLYVWPEYRGGFLAARLIKTFEQKARNLGCWHVRAGVSTELTVESTLALYERLGYRRTGNGICKRIR